MDKSAEVVNGRVVAPKPGWTWLERIGVALLAALAALVWILSPKLLF